MQDFYEVILNDNYTQYEIMVVQMNTQIPEEVIENIRRENDIVDIIEEYVSLKKQGRNYFGLCPFHDEKSPSFSVTKEKQIFHCFGCGKGGNVITFLMEVESLNFIEAISFLGDKAGISLPERSDKQSHLSEEAHNLLSAYDWLSKYYYHLLKYSDDGKDAKQYLIDRGITEKTIDEFQLGYATVNSEFTVEFLLKKGFHQQSLVKAGLLSTKDNQHFTDVFRGRAVFPIRNHLGRTVAFGGRSFQGEEPKYLNSPEHELFQKGNLLFNFDLAKRHIRKSNQAVIFEGYMDVLAAHQVKVTNGVATLGTALTTNQAKLLKRYADTVIICYDADSAGFEASYQAAQLLQQIGCEVKVANIPDNMDPDDYIMEYGGSSFFEQVINRSDSFFRFYMKYKRTKFDLSIESERITYVEEMITQLATVESSIEREFHVKEIADEFNLSTDIIHHDVEEHKKRNNQQYKNNSYKKSNTNNVPKHYVKSKMLPAYNNAERFLLAHMLKQSNIIGKVQQTLGVQFNIDEHKIILTHLYALYENYDEVSVSQLIDKLEDDYLKQIVTEIAMIPTNEMVTEQVLDDYIYLIRAESTDVAYLRTLEQKQKQEQNPILAAEIGSEIIELKKQLKQMK